MKAKCLQDALASSEGNMDILTAGSIFRRKKNIIL